MTEEQVLAFVRRAIRSAWALEVLLALRREPQRSWSTEALVRQLRASIQAIGEGLAMLRDAGLVAATDTGEHVYRPASPELGELVDSLVQLYAQKPITVLRTIFTSPTDKIRSFADAFIFRRK